LAILTGSEENEEITEVMYGIDYTINRGVQFMQNASEKMDLFGEKNGPSIIIEFPDIYKNNYIAAKKRGVKIRFITEITKENIHYCKKILNIVTEMRHLEGLTGGIAVTEKEYMTTTSLKNKQLLTQVFYSNAFEVVRQGQYIFDTFWDKAIPASQRIKEIEEGIEPIKTKILENQNEIYNHLKKSIENSTERYVCSSIGGMDLVYNNFFNLYKEIIERQKRGEGNGIKWITHLDNNKNNIEVVKRFLKTGIQVRHTKNLPSMNFAVDSKSIQATIERMDKGKLMNSLLVSNEPAYVNHFMLFFQELWDNYGIDATERIKDIEVGMEYDIEVIRHSDKTLDLYLEIVQLAQTEILLILPTPKGFIRQLKAIFLAKQISRERKVKVRILTPSNEIVEEWIKILLENKIEGKDNNNVGSIIEYSFYNHDVKIRYIEKMSHTKATILVVDGKESLVMELKDDTKDTFIDAIGLSTHSTSKASVLSYVAIFENLWKQSELYHEIKESNEKLKANDIILNDFINIAAHEMRNPIQPILGLSEQVRKKTLDDEQKKLLDVVIKNAKKLKQLSEDILDLAKIESKTLSLYKEKFDIVELLLNLKEEFKTECYQNKILIIVSAKGYDNYKDDFMLYADKKRLTQVVYNLINNAIKFTSKGSIYVITEKNTNNNALIIKVQDSGIGIDDDIYPKLFTKFVTKSKDGTGLGLYICKNIVEAHGGKMWAENNMDRKGATFSFSLPFDNH
jgi:signal transduction histidine kinase